MIRDVPRDSLAVINGPEDGNLFPIAGSPCHIGSDVLCQVQVRLDRTVQAKHVMLTPAHGGYRVRCTAGAPAYADGRRVGRLHSRILLPGSVLQVGHTALLLKCASGGLAERFTGVDLHGDLSWSLRMVAHGLRAGLSNLLTLIADLLAMLRRNWKVVLPIALVVGYFFAPPVRNLILWAIYYVRMTLRGANL